MTHELSLIGLFLQADIIVKGVMLILVVASIGCWTLALDKALRLAAVRRQTRRFEAAHGLSSLREPPGEIARAVVAAGLRAWQDYDGGESRFERRARIERAMRGALAPELRRLETGLPFLATVGSTAPFVGLFGTVWGIMNSFSAIAQSQDTSLAVVAPGIAEALFATAIGLVAAIPAVIAYNRLAVGLGRLSQRLGAVIAEIGDALSREQVGLAKAAE